jgi:hypothetical protein
VKIVSCGKGVIAAGGKELCRTETYSYQYRRFQENADITGTGSLSAW